MRNKIQRGEKMPAIISVIVVIVSVWVLGKWLEKREVKKTCMEDDAADLIDRNMPSRPFR